MTFARPILFWLLALLPGLALLLVWGFRARQRALERFAGPALAPRLADRIRPVAQRWKAVLLSTAVLGAMLALTQPRWGFEWQEVKQRGRDIVVVLDVSRSMLAEDVRPNRLTQAKFAVQDLLDKLRGDRVGLVAFAGTAFVQCPLTVDYEAFRLTLKDAEPRIIPRGGTAIGAALRTALKAFEGGQSRDRAIVLITDGEATAGDTAAAAAEVANAGVKIYAIGVGTADGELIPVREAGQSPGFVKDQDGKVVKSRLDEATLRQLALQTGGMYVRSAAGDFGIEAIYAKGLARLQRTEHETHLRKRYFERFQWPLGLALVLLAVESLVSDRRKA